MPKLTKG